MARPSFSTIVDGVDYPEAADINPIYTAVQNHARALAYADYTTHTTATGNITLTNSSDPVQSIDCNGAHRDVNLPTLGTSNGMFYIYNRTAATYNITVKNAGGTSVGTITPGKLGIAISDNTNNWVLLSPPASGIVEIDNQTLVSNGTFSFSSIPALYTHLQLRLYLRSTYTTNYQDVAILRIDGSTTAANYHSFLHSHFHSATESSLENIGTLGYAHLGYVPNANSVSSVFGTITVDIPLYRATGLKTGETRFFAFTRSLTAYLLSGQAGFAYNSTSTIASLDVLARDAASNQFAAGSRAILYGIG